MPCWTCAFCHFLNFETETHCRTCKRPKGQAKRDRAEFLPPAPTGTENAAAYRYVVDEPSRRAYKLAGFRTHHPLQPGSLITVGIAQYRVEFPNGRLCGDPVSLTELPTSVPTHAVDHVSP